MDNNTDLNSLIHQMGVLKAEKKALEFTLKQVEKQITATTLGLMNRLDSLQMISAKNPQGQSATITAAVVPKVENWDLFHQHIRDTGDFFLLEKRPAVIACRETFEMGRVLPGVLPLTIRRLTFKE